jgi:signal transduction histidine kinase
VAHELNTPIGNGLLAASALAERTDDFAGEVAVGNISRAAFTEFLQDAGEAAKILQRNLEKAGELIRSFKQVAVDQASSQRRAFALKEIVDEVLLAHRPMLRGGRVEVQTEIPGDLWLDSYPGPLGQVLGNLITNAVLHGHEDNDQGVVTIAAGRRTPEQVEITVRDQGRGISEEDLRRIFDPFFTTRMGRGGTGLGLGICQNIVAEMLGGSINVESRVGRGTTVVVLIPLTAPAPARGTAIRSGSDPH